MARQLKGAKPMNSTNNKVGKKVTEDKSKQNVSKKKPKQTKSGGLFGIFKPQDKKSKQKDDDYGDEYDLDDDYPEEGDASEDEEDEEE